MSSNGIPRPSTPSAFDTSTVSPIRRQSSGFVLVAESAQLAREQDVFEAQVAPSSESEGPGIELPTYSRLRQDRTEPPLRADEALAVYEEFEAAFPGAMMFYPYSGGTYRGMWSAEKPNGVGIHETSAFRYSGEFVDGLKHGHGIYTFDRLSPFAGYAFEGEFVQGVMHGEGDMITRSTHGRTACEWQDGKPITQPFKATQEAFDARRAPSTLGAMIGDSFGRASAWFTLARELTRG